LKFKKYDGRLENYGENLKGDVIEEIEALYNRIADLRRTIARKRTMMVYARLRRIEATLNMLEDRLKDLETELAELVEIPSYVVPLYPFMSVKDALTGTEKEVRE